jgi:nitroreductase
MGDVAYYLVRGLIMPILNASQECNHMLDEILSSRRSIRSFRDEAPPRELIKDVLRAGLLGPYAGAAVSGDDFRRFAVIVRGSPSMVRAAELIQRHVQGASERLNQEMARNPDLKSRAQRFAKRLEAISREGITGVGTAPYYIVVAERRGFPPVEQQSLAHSMENMWLKATALGLGFHLVSATAEMGGDKEFCDLLGLPYGQFELNGCAIGYPAVELPMASRPDIDQVTRWID